MFFMGGRVVNTINTEEFLLILTIKGDKIGMEKTLLGQLVLIADGVQIKASA